MATNIRKVIMIRTYIAYGGMCLFAIAIVAYLIKIQYVEKKYWLEMAENIGTTIQTVEPARGNIFACDNSLLATSLPIYDLRLDGKAPGFLDDEIFDNQVDSLSFYLANLFEDRSQSDYKRIITNVRRRKDRYYLLKRKVSYLEMKQVISFPIFKLGKYKGGLNIEEHNRREKPFDLLAERTIGYSIKGIAPVGIEGAFDKELAGKPGKRVMQRIAGGTWIPINDEEQIEAQNGKDIVTTLDVNIQDVAEQALYNTLVANDAQWGTAILMEVKTGEIKAIANLTRQSEGNYTEQYNYAIGESLEPGSTFKLASMLALLDDGKAKMTDRYDTENGQKRYTSTAVMYDSEPGGHGILNFQQAFELSSNVAISKAVFEAYKNNPQQFYDHLVKLKLTKPIGLQITGEGKPMIKSPSDKGWSGTTLPWSSIGYEIKVTPMQILALYNAIANNGKMVKPLLVKEIQKTGRSIRSYKTETMVEQICKPSTLNNLRTMMEGVVLHGTATNLKNPNYTVAGKTGTALVADGRRGYAQKIYRSSFCGYFPAESPEYTCMVMVNGPSKGIYYGSAVAGPVFKEIADKVYSNSTHLHPELKLVKQGDSAFSIPQIPFGYKDEIVTIYELLGYSAHSNEANEEEAGTEWTNTQVLTKNIKLTAAKQNGFLIPNTIGMGIKDALYLLENAGLKVKVEGVGKVKYQSLQPGSKLVKGSSINIQLG